MSPSSSTTRRGPLGRRAAAAVLAAVTVAAPAVVTPPWAAGQQAEAPAPKPGMFAAIVGPDDAYGMVSGKSSDISFSNLPAGSVVTAVGPEGVNLLAKSIATTVDPESGLARAEAKGVAVPTDAALIGKRVYVTYEVGGKQSRYDGHVLIAPDVRDSGSNRFTITGGDAPVGLYQSAYSARTKTLFVTRTEWTDAGPVSSLLAMDPETLTIRSSVNVDPKFPIFGIALDETAGTVWATNSVGDSVAVYRQSDLGLVKQFAEGSSNHARSVVVDTQAHRAYVSLPTDAEDGVGRIDVYDTTSLTKLPGLTLPGFGGPMGLDLDTKTGRLFTVSLDLPKAAAIDARGNGAATVYDLPGNPGDSPSGVAWDPERHNIWVASQGTNNVVAYNVDAKKVVADLPAANGALGATYDPASKLVYVSNFGADVVSVFDARALTTVAQVQVGAGVNHTAVDGRGNAYVVNKGKHTVPGKDGSFNHVTKLTPRQGPLGSVTGSLPGSASGSVSDLPGAGSLGSLSNPS